MVETTVLLMFVLNACMHGFVCTDHGTTTTLTELNDIVL